MHEGGSIKDAGIGGIGAGGPVGAGSGGARPRVHPQGQVRGKTRAERRHRQLRPHRSERQAPGVQQASGQARSDQFHVHVLPGRLSAADGEPQDRSGPHESGGGQSHPLPLHHHGPGGGYAEGAQGLQPAAPGGRRPLVVAHGRGPGAGAGVAGVRGERAAAGPGAHRAHDAHGGGGRAGPHALCLLRLRSEPGRAAEGPAGARKGSRRLRILPVPFPQHPEMDGVLRLRSASPRYAQDERNSLPFVLSPSTSSGQALAKRSRRTPSIVVPIPLELEPWNCC